MKATFRHTGSVTDGVTLRVTLCHLQRAAYSVTPLLWQSRHHRERNRDRHPQRAKALHFGIFPDYVTPNVTPSVTPENPINKGITGIVLHLLHL